jgi:ATP-dependent helicase/nuclease subunit A
VRGDDPAKTAAERRPATSCKELLQKLTKDCLCATAAEYREDIEDLRPKSGFCSALVGSFGEKLLELKAAKKKLDYADLEHMASLSAGPADAGGAYIRTEHAARIAERYDLCAGGRIPGHKRGAGLIFSSVSRGMRNLFMVGDV